MLIECEGGQLISGRITRELEIAFHRQLQISAFMKTDKFRLISLKHYDARMEAHRCDERKDWKKSPIVWMIRARAPEMHVHSADAIAEYKAYLKSNPPGEAHARIAREALERLRKRTNR